MLMCALAPFVLGALFALRIPQEWEAIVTFTIAMAICMVPIMAIIYWSRTVLSIRDGFRKAAGHPKGWRSTNNRRPRFDYPENEDPS
jgi:hypothetical protein